MNFARFGLAKCQKIIISHAKLMQNSFFAIFFDKCYDEYLKAAFVLSTKVICEIESLYII